MGKVNLQLNLKHNSLPAKQLIQLLSMLPDGTKIVKMYTTPVLEETYIILENPLFEDMSAWRPWFQRDIANISGHLIDVDYLKDADLKSILRQK